LNVKDGTPVVLPGVPLAYSSSTIKRMKTVAGEEAEEAVK